MTGESTNTAGTRAQGVIVLKTLKSPEEGGTKKEYEDFLEKIDSHVSINWEFGQDIAHAIRNNETPTFKEPIDLNDEDKKSQWKVRLWNQTVDRYGRQLATLDDNMGALFSLLHDNLSKLMKSKVKAKKGYAKAEEDKDTLWLLKTLEDVSLNFEENKPKLLAVDDQMERIMKIKQGDTTNEDFVKLITKELKVYEKHGGDFLWGKTQARQYATRTRMAIDEFDENNGGPPSVEEEKEIKSMVTKALKEEILAMAMLKRADKKRFGNLQISLKNSYLLGTNDYPKTVAGVLKILNNYKSEYTPPSATPTTTGSGNAGNK